MNHLRESKFTFWRKQFLNGGLGYAYISQQLYAHFFFLPSSSLIDVFKP